MHVLIVEDKPHDAELIVVQLQQEGFAVNWRRVHTEAAYREGLANNPDLVLSDWNLPQFSGQHALEILQQEHADIPFIIVSGSVGEETAVDVLRQGASDYVLKDRPARLGEAVRRALGQKRLRQEYQQAQEQLRLADRAFQNTAEGVTVTDINGNIVSVNPAFEEITGYSAAEVLGKNPRILQSGRHFPAFYREMWSSLLNTGHWRGEIWNKRKNDVVYPGWLSISAVPDTRGQTSHYVAMFSDISRIKEAQSKIDFLAYHDPLTKLPNRLLFKDRLVHALARSEREQNMVAILFIDLDRFKFINDTLGHPVGDTVLLEVADRMNKAIRRSDTLARLGGDEFVLVIDEDASVQHAATVARKLLTLVSRPMNVSGHELVITASIGVSVFPNDGDDADTLIRHADRSMYEAKERGRNNFQVFKPSLTKGALEQLKMESALRVAIDRHEMELHYQPQINMTDGSILGVEALVRWRHPRLGLLPPERFIPVAEEIGAIGEIGAWVMGAACRQLADWDSQGFFVPRVAVNLSVKQITATHLLQQVTQQLQEARLAPYRLELEVTESTLMRDPEMSRSVFSSLKALGVGLAADDFGTGYSSLAYLKLLPLGCLKIDRSFVCDIGQDADDEAIVRAIIALANSLNLTTVAEGVENATQQQFLIDEGCKVAQGHYFCRPLPAIELLSWAHH